MPTRATAPLQYCARAHNYTHYQLKLAYLCYAANYIYCSIADGMTVIVSSLRVNVYDGIAPIGAYVNTITDHKNYKNYNNKNYSKCY